MVIHDEVELKEFNPTETTIEGALPTEIQALLLARQIQ